jgi:hypothetical protein
LFLSARDEEIVAFSAEIGGDDYVQNRSVRANWSPG